MKKLLLFLMVFLFLGVFTVSAATNPVNEKQAMSFAVDTDVGLLVDIKLSKDPIESDVNIDTVTLHIDESLYRKIVYEATESNGSNRVFIKLDVTTVGDHKPISV